MSCKVTILILIDGFLQYGTRISKRFQRIRHNPYFNRWFSAITVKQGRSKLVLEVTILILIDGFLQSRSNISGKKFIKSHNPYFNRWFSAIWNYNI